MTRFEELCTAFCKLVDMAPPDLATGPGGFTVLPMEFEGTEVALAQRPDQPGSLLVIGNLGASPHRDGADAMATLLDANFLLAGRDAPTFSRNPDTGEFLVQCVTAIADCTPASVLSSIRHIAQLAARWRAGEFTDDSGAAETALRAERQSFA